MYIHDNMAENCSYNEMFLTVIVELNTLCYKVVQICPGLICV